MKYILCLLFLLSPYVSHALTYPEYINLSSIKGKIIYHAFVHGVDPDLALYIAEKESTFDPKETGDKDIICKRTGEAVYARGLFQITRCYHPEVKDSEAFNEDFSILWSIPKMKNREQCKQEWTTCRTYVPKNRNIENYPLVNTS